MIHGILKTATPLTEEQLRCIERGFADKMGTFVSFQIETDPSLIGGFQTIIEGMVYDASLKAQLDRMGRAIRG